jgi:hypothetical protein
LCAYPISIGGYCVHIPYPISIPISWDQPTSTTAHNSHQFCVRVVSPEDEQVMPETCRDIEHQ